MNFTKYEKYKDSGLEWLGEIPENWELKRVKTIGVVNGRVGWKALKASEYVDKSDYFFLATPNIKNNEIDFVNVNYLTKERYDESPEIMLEIDDILLTKDGSTLGTVNIVKYLPSKGTVNSSIAVLRFNKHFFNKFVFYQIKSDYLQNVISLKKDGAGVPHLFQKDINNFAIISPPIKTQTAIAEYLDEKTAQIDKKIELLRAKKEKYRELRKMIVNEAVTKGIDKNVLLKVSGVERLGKIPKHWEVKRLKNVFKLQNGYGFSIEEQGNTKGEIPFYKVSDINGNGKYVSNASNYVEMETVKKNGWKIIPNDSILTAKIGEALKKNHRKINEGICLIDNNCVALIPRRKLFDTNYLFWILKIIDFNMFDNMGTVPSMSSQSFNSFLFAFPSLTEQKQIADYLEEKTNTIDEIILTIDKNIEVLNEFRKTLINDAVTGKIKIAQGENNSYDRNAVAG
jgi:type I restriction enzyme S subunit